MAGYVCIGALAAFGLISGIWIACGFFLPDTRAGGLVLSGPLEGSALSTARRWVWLREMGLLYSPLLAVADTFDADGQQWLCCQGFILCSRAELLRRLGIGESEIDTGFGDPPGRHQRCGISEL